MQRRTLLAAAWPAWAAHAGASSSAQSSASSSPARPALRAQHLAMAWREAPDQAQPHHNPDAGYHVGVLKVDWINELVAVLARVPVPTRAHGLVALADGGWVAVANRPGRWLVRLDAQGQVLQRHNLESEQPPRTLNGHAVVSGDGRWLFTTETDPVADAGWVSVRDARTLTRVAQFSSHGVDPHQLLLASDGALMVANGGIPRDALARKRVGEPLAPGLVRLGVDNGSGGPLLGRWTLPDPHISLRHMAWNHHGAQPLLGIALQAEHPGVEQRRQAPTLAVWDGQRLHVPSIDARSAGYAGDIAAGPGGGFVVSAQKTGLVVWWHPAQPDTSTVVAQMTEPCAVLAAANGAGAALIGARGLARWHAHEAPQMLRWPLPLAPDNHAVWLQELV